MKINFSSLLLLIALLGYTFYLSARAFLPVPDFIYQNLFLLVAFALVESTIVCKTVSLSVSAELATKRATIIMAVFSGLNALLAGIVYWRLSSDKWLAGIWLNASAYPILPYFIAIGALIWLVIMLRSPEVQRQLLPVDIVDRILRFAGDPKHEVGIVLGLYIIGISLRLINIAGYPPANDEHYQLRATFDFLNGLTVNYQRAFYTVSLPMAVFFKLLGPSLFNARLPMILINMLAIFPLYALMRKVNRLVGFTAVGLFIINPNIVALAQLARDYAITPVFMYTILWIMSIMVISPHFSNPIKEFTKNQLKGVTLLLILLFIFFFGKQSVLQANLVLYAVFLGLVVGFSLFSDSPKWIKALILIGTIIVFIVILNLPSRKPLQFSESGLILNFSTTPLLVLGWQSYTNWSFIFPQTNWVIGIVGLFLIFTAIRDARKPTNRFMLMVLIPFFAALVYMSFFLYGESLGRGYRYAVFLMELLIPIAALVWVQAGRRVNTTLVGQPFMRLAFLAGVFFVFFFNLPAFNALARFKGDSVFVITDITHQSTEDAVEMLENIEQPARYLLSDNFISALQLSKSKISITELDPFNTVRKGKRTLSEAISEHPEGWMMLIEDDAMAMGYEPVDFSIPEADFSFERKGSNSLLWHWKLK